MPEWTLANKGQPVSLSQLNQVAKELTEAGKMFDVWLLEGSMGAGKTTLTKALAAQAGVQDMVSSPTFSLVNEYTSPSGEPVYHFDFYRIKSEMEAYDIGVHEYFDSGHRCWVEWFEKIPGLLPDRYFHLKIELVDPEHRIISFRAHE